MKTLLHTIIYTCGLIAFLISDPADAWDNSQHIKYNSLSVDYPDHSLATLNGGTSQDYNNINYRLNLTEQFSHIKIESHYEFVSKHSNSDNLSYINPDSKRLFNLTRLINESAAQMTYHRLDRMYITYNTKNTTIHFGRQAITWGNGLVFNVMDIFNPFSPTATDTEYKSGDDMLYLQSLTDAGSDWQFIVLPRRNLSGKLDSEFSSTAAKFHSTLSSTDIDVLFASHYNESIIGLGISHAIEESLWRLDITHSSSLDNENITSLSTNIDQSWIIFGKNMYGFIEYYYNGWGIKNSNGAADPVLLSKIQRGEIFTLYRDYLATGLRIETHPLLNISPALIYNTTDKSSLFSLSAQYDWLQNLSATAKVILVNGSTTSEYDGLYSPGNSVQLFISYYF